MIGIDLQYVVQVQNALESVKIHEKLVTSGSQILGPWVYCFYLPMFHVPLFI